MRTKFPFSALLISAIMLASLSPHLAAPSRGAAAVPAPTPLYYLALGSKAAIGYQMDPAVDWTHGYVYQVRDMLAATGPVELTNLAHRGECSDTFINGGLAADCSTKVIDSPSQMAEAVAFILDHAGRMRLITVDIGGANFNSNLKLVMNPDLVQRTTYLIKFYAQLVHDWNVIFGTLRQACPNCEIVALNQWNPFPAGSTKVDVAPIIVHYNDLMRMAARPYHIRMADVYTPFVGHALTYTWFAKGDGHPTTEGYTVMANVVWQVVNAPAS